MMFYTKSITPANLRLLTITTNRVSSYRHQSTEAAIGTTEEWAKAKPFSSIPGPSVIDMIRNYLPGGALHKTNTISMVQHFRSTYGKLCKMPAMFGRPAIVFSFDPSHSQLLYRTEGQWPVRRGLDTFTHYRTKVRPDVFGGMGGLVSDQGETWYKMRSKVNPVMMQPRSVRSYVAPVDAISREFVRKMAILRDSRDEMPADFGDELAAWALESIGVVALDRRLGAMAFDRDPETDRLIESVRDFFRLAYNLEFKPSLWRYYKTKDYRDLMTVFDVMTNTVMKHIDETMNANKAASQSASHSEDSVLQRLLKIDRHYALLMTFDMLFAGIDTTSSTVAIFLHHLALNPDKQEKLRAEIMQILPTVDAEITESGLNSAAYFRAALKESMRIQPINPVNFRGTAANIVLDGYQIPKDTDVMMGNILMMNDDKYFENSASFEPERFLRDAQGNLPQTPDYSPFVYLPFGFGTRMCVGKRFAELEIQLLVTRILREYRVEWHHGDIEYGSGLITAPRSDLRFRIVKLAD